MTLSEEVRKACADGPLTAREVADATGIEYGRAKKVLSRQCYCLFMGKTHDVPARYFLTKEPRTAPLSVRADVLAAMDGWTSAEEVSFSTGIPMPRVHSVLRRALASGAVERRPAKGRRVEWKVTERGMEMMEGMEKMEAMEGCE